MGGCWLSAVRLDPLSLSWLQLPDNYLRPVYSPALCIVCCFCGEMWRRFSLLVLCCAVSGLDALEADRSADPSPEKMLLTEAAELGKPYKDAPSAAQVEDGLRGGEQQRGAPVVGAEGRVQQPTAEPLEDELDNQENIISQVSV